MAEVRFLSEPGRLRPAARGLGCRARTPSASGCCSRTAPATSSPSVSWPVCTPGPSPCPLHRAADAPTTRSGSPGSSRTPLRASRSRTPLWHPRCPGCWPAAGTGTHPVCPVTRCSACTALEPARPAFRHRRLSPVHLGFHRTAARRGGHPREPPRQPAGDPRRAENRARVADGRLASPPPRHGPRRSVAPPALAGRYLRHAPRRGVHPASGALAGGRQQPWDHRQRCPGLRVRPAACAGCPTSSSSVSTSPAGAPPSPVVNPSARRRCRDFAERFAPAGFRAQSFTACYGLAEATLLVAGSRGTQPRRERTVDAQALERHLWREPTPGRPTRRLPSCGSAVGCEIRIVDPETRAVVPDGRIGEIWVRAPGWPRATGVTWARRRESSAPRRPTASATSCGPETSARWTTAISM